MDRRELSSARDTARQACRESGRSRHGDADGAVAIFSCGCCAAMQAKHTSLGVSGERRSRRAVEPLSPVTAANEGLPKRLTGGLEHVGHLILDTPRCHRGRREPSRSRTAD